MTRVGLTALAATVALVAAGCGVGASRPARFLAHDRASVDGRLWSSHTHDPGGAWLHYFYEYGKTQGYGSRTQLTNFLLSDLVADYDISEKITGLQPGTTYHWRLCAGDDDNSGLPGCSADRTFTTPTTTGPYLTLLPFCEFPSGAFDGLDISGTGFPPGDAAGPGPPVGFEISRNGGPYQEAGTVRANSAGDIDFNQTGFPSGTVDTFDLRAFDDPNFSSTLDPGEQVLATGHLVDTCTPS